MSRDKIPNFKPISGSELPRYAGIPTFMRLPNIEAQSELARSHVDVGIVGIPWDGGTTNRAGARHGPRQMRDMSTLMRNVHHVSGIQPFELVKCADMGDSPVNPILIDDTIERVEKFVRSIVDDGITPLFAGGDHLVSLPIMRAIKDKLCGGKPMGMVHFDAHTDTWDRYFGGSMYTHGTPFRRAIEEGLLDPKRTVQVGIRGSLYTPEDKDWGLEQGIRVIEIEEYFDLSVEGVIAEARRVVGDQPTYVSFDVDCLDPVYAPGTGTPEIGGMTTYEAQRIIRGLRGVDIISADVVEVSPPFDQSGATALVGVTILWEILCLLAENMVKKGMVK